MPVFLDKRDLEVFGVPRSTRVQVVCGNCCGTEERPRRTLLTVDGRCDQCGGRSYELASMMFAPRAWHWREDERAKVAALVDSVKRC